jgi:hypothetical protein
LPNSQNSAGRQLSIYDFPAQREIYPLLKLAAIDGKFF